MTVRADVLSAGMQGAGMISIHRIVFLAVLVAASPLFLSQASAEDQTGQRICQFIDERGVIRSVPEESLPREAKSSARCFESKPQSQPQSQPQRAGALAAPSEIELDGSVRRRELSSPIGIIHLRWPVTVQRLFGRSPSRATLEAARAVARGISKPGFPSHVQRMSIRWNVVFLDAELPETQIPANLRAGCHPGWMTAQFLPGVGIQEANVYIVGQRVATGCGDADRLRVDTRVSDQHLIEVLVHEMGHAVEFQWLRGMVSSDRLRAEGFATWFEQYVGDHSYLVRKSDPRRQHAERAEIQRNLSKAAFTFSGTALDYSRASMYFAVIEAQKGVYGIARVYERLAEGKTDFFFAVEEELRWDRERIEAEVERYLRKH
ncbi:MAG: hypothetical protein KDD44_02825 [Bdellovibrionales bacterium]|nr:hypothetical protein [Bdellovibrionales bacterium]